MKDVPARERQKASTLASFTLVLFVLSFVSTLLFSVTNVGADVGSTAIWWLGTVAVLAAYVFSRSRFYPLSGYIITYLSTLLVLLPAFSGLYSTSTALAAPLTVIIASLIFGWRDTLLSGILSSAAVLLGYAISNYTAPLIEISTIVAVIAIATVILTYTSYQRGQYLSALEASRNQLQEQIVLVEQARQRAEHSDQVKSAFLASMSHELRTPLNAVINFTRFVIDGDTGPVNEQQTELLTEVVGSAKHLLNLINDVLDMSKIESGALNLFVEEDVNMEALLKSALITGQSLLRGKPVALKQETADTLPLMRGDKQRILQILLNIISNACKFTEEGEIVVRSQRADDDIIISVKDTGPGILPEDHAMVFEAFKQTSTGLRQAGGTGLGMPIARSLAEAHGGRLWLESEFGKGTTFYLSIPIKSDALVPVLTK